MTVKQVILSNLYEIAGQSKDSKDKDAIYKDLKMRIDDLALTPDEMENAIKRICKELDY